MVPNLLSYLIIELIILSGVKGECHWKGDLVFTKYLFKHALTFEISVFISLAALRHYQNKKNWISVYYIFI